MTCKHNWEFTDDSTMALKCTRCKAETGPRTYEQRVKDILTVPTAQLQQYKLHDSRPNSIRFFSPDDTSTEVLRISKDGIWANPEIPTDEAAKKVLAAVDGYVKQMIERAIEDDTGVTWGVDWGRAGEKSCATIIKRLPNGKIKVMAVEYEP